MTIAEQDVPVLTQPSLGSQSPTRKDSSSKVPHGRPISGVSRTLMLRAERTVATCKEAGLAHVRPIAVGPTIQGPVYYPIDSDWSMVVVPSLLDPTGKANGRFPVPGEVMRHLRKVIDAELEFDQTYIAHELTGQPYGVLSKELTSQQLAMVVPSPPPTQTSQKLATVLEQVGSATRTVARVSGRVAVGIASAAAVAVLAPLDPAVFGVLVGEHREYGVWFGVTSWLW